MNPYKTRKGLSAVVIIIIILVLAGLGAGVYFTYDDYIAPLLNPSVKLIPKGLVAYARGADADAFVIIKKDPIVERTIKGMPIASAAGQFKSAIILYNSQKHAGAVIAEFSSADSAIQASEQINKILMDAEIIDFSFEQKENILIASYGGGLNSFTGLLLDNPNIKYLDPAMMESQVIGLIDQTRIAGLSIPIDPMNTASSPEQAIIRSINGIFPAIMNSTFYLRIKDAELTLKTTISFLENNEPASDVISELQKQLDTLKSMIPGTTANAVFNKNQLELSFSGPFEDLKKYIPESFTTLPSTSDTAPATMETTPTDSIDATMETTATDATDATMETTAIDTTNMTTDPAQPTTPVKKPKIKRTP